MEENKKIENKEVRKTSRSKTRRFLFQYLYAIAHGETSRDEFMSSFYKESYIDKIDWIYFKEVCKGIIEKESLIIAAIAKFAPKFKVETMQVEHLIPMFIAIYEMLYYSEELPYKISINEAIELSKIYCDDSNRKLVNGVLNNIALKYKEVKEEIEAKTLDKGNIFFKIDKNNI